MAGGCAWQGHVWLGGMHGRGHAWWGACVAGGACMAGGMRGRGACMAGSASQGGMHATHAPWQYEIWSVNARAVRILLECILV